MTDSRYRFLAAVGALVMVAFAVRAVSIDAQPLWRDEVDALRFATVPWSEMLASFTRPGWNGPLYFLLLRSWVALAGQSECAMRFFSLIFGVLCVPLIYVLGRRLFNRRTALLAALLTTTSPYLTWYSQEVKMYTLTPALALLAIYGLRRALSPSPGHLAAKGSQAWWMVQIVATTLAFYSHILAALLIPVQGLLCLIWWAQTRRHRSGVLISLFGLTLPYLPLIIWQAPLALQKRDTGFEHYSLDQMAQTLISGWSLGISGAQSWSGLLVERLAEWSLQILGWRWPLTSVQALTQALEPALMGVLAVWGLASLTLASRKKDGWQAPLALLIWLATPLLIVWIISLRQPIFTDRYLIWIAPAFYLLVALGLASFSGLGGWGRWAERALMGLILISNVVNLWQQASVTIKSDFRAAAAYVADYYHNSGGSVSRQPPAKTYAFKCYLPLVLANCCGFDELILFQIPYARHTFDYYFPDEHPWADGPYTNHRGSDGHYLMDEQGAARRMQGMTEGYDVVWMVAAEAALWDERALAHAWLEENWRLVDAAHFTQVDVYRYVR